MSLNNQYNINDLQARSAAIRSNPLNPLPGSPVVVEKDIIVGDNTAFRSGGLLLFIVIAIIVGILLYIFHPALVQSTGLDGSQYTDFAKVVLWSIIFSLIVVFILWLFRDTHKMF
jgi:hypothetical protein